MRNLSQLHLRKEKFADSLSRGVLSRLRWARSNAINIADEDEEPRCIQLTNQHKGAIRAIRKVSSPSIFKFSLSHFRT